MILSHFLDGLTFDGHLPEHGDLLSPIVVTHPLHSSSARWSTGVGRFPGRKLHPSGLVLGLMIFAHLLCSQLDLTLAESRLLDLLEDLGSHSLDLQREGEELLP